MLVCQRKKDKTLKVYTRLKVELSSRSTQKFCIFALWWAGGDGRKVIQQVCTHTQLINNLQRNINCQVFTSPADCIAHRPCWQAGFRLKFEEKNLKRLLISICFQCSNSRSKITYFPRIGQVQVGHDLHKLLQ